MLRVVGNIARSIECASATRNSLAPAFASTPRRLDDEPRESTFHGTVNSVTLIGLVGADPVQKTFENGGSQTAFNLATTDTYVTDGKVHRRTDWHRIVTNDPKVGEIVGKMVKKGSRVYVKGAMKTRTFTDAETKQDRAVFEVIVSRRRSGEILVLNPSKKPE
eukprot:TRINITY_DN6671_c0_g1_i1.p1 TRINITY_DN6671_c0_g1~~TRINITY_DN6671_c0_g1_i1.p1  ORF type:complete len:163 (-),score=25.72 TRINITY_DN6671_c0_g1_i1:25-513(-)